MPVTLRNQILLLLAILAGGMWELYLIDDGLGISWAQNVVRNWQQFGFLNLHGQLVTNPGGFQIHSAPDVYAGMSPLCIWPAFFLTQLFAWTGLGTLSFHLILALAVFWAVWELLGRDQFAFVVAAAAVLSPGYDRWQKGLDPNAISVLLGLPYAAVVIFLLKKPRLGGPALAGLGVLTLAFISLNWTTAWVLGPLALLLIGLPQVNRRSLILFVGLAAAASVLFVGLSAVNKAGGGHHAPGQLSLFLRSYLWGNVGYGEGLKTSHAFLLLAFTNGIGLLTLWLLGAWAFGANTRKAGPFLWLCLAPLFAAMADAVIMRNYFGHHPWMAAPVLLVGLVFSLVLLRGRMQKRPAGTGFASPLARPSFLPALLCAACLLYGVAVLMFFRANENNQLSLLRLIRHHTARATTIVIVRPTDPQLAQMAARFDELFDRHVMVVDDLKDLPDRENVTVLSATAGESLKLIAQNGGAKAGIADSLVPVAAWFNRTIAHRRAGDRLELGKVYFLYDPKP